MMSMLTRKEMCERGSFELLMADLVAQNGPIGKNELFRLVRVSIKPVKKSLARRGVETGSNALAYYLNSLVKKGIVVNHHKVYSISV